MFRLWAAITFLCLSLPALSLGARGRPVLRIDQLETGKGPQVRIFLSDLDSAGSPTTDRKPASYRLLVDGVPQVAAERLQRLHQTAESLAVTFVIQVSPALRDALAEVVEACKRMIKGLPAGSKVGLIAYTDVVVKDLKPGPATAALEVVDDLHIYEEALEVQLPDALRDALEGLENPALPTIRYLVVLSDGLTAELNFMVFSELGRKAKERGVIVHSIGFAPLEPARLRTLSELSKRGGGTFREAQTPEEITQGFGTLLEEMRNQLVLVYSIPKFFDGKLHDFQIETSGGLASNIVPAELAKIAQPKKGSASWYRSTWFLILLAAMGQIGLVLLAWFLYRMRARARGLEGASMGREDEAYMADEDEEDEDEEDYPDEEEDEGDEDEDEDEPRGGGSRRKSGHREGRRPLESLLSPESTPWKVPAMPAPEEPREARYSSPGRGPGPVSQVRGQVAGSIQTRSSPSLRDPLPGAGTGGRGSMPGGAVPRSHAGPPGPVRHFPDPSAGYLPEPPRGGSVGGGTAQIPDMPPGRRSGPEPPFAPEQGQVSSAQAFHLPLPDPQEYIAQGSVGQIPAPVYPDGSELGQPAAFSSSMPSAAARRDESSQFNLNAELFETHELPSVEDQQRAIQAKHTGHNIPLVAGSGIPFGPAAAEAPMVSSPQGAGVRPGRFIDRQTQVMSVDGESGLAFTAWILPLDKGLNVNAISMLQERFVMGSDPGCNLQVEGEGVLSQHAVIELDTQGFQIQLFDERGTTHTHPLQDDDHFFIGDREFVFKVATRHPQRQIAYIRLEVMDGMDRGRSIPLQEGMIYTLGAHSSCDLVVRGDQVEKRHAIVLRKERTCIISDLGAEAGVLFRGEKVGYKRLRPGEEVVLGTVRLVYIFDDYDEQQGNM